MSEKEKAIILIMLEATDKIGRYTHDLQNAEEFAQDAESFDATLMNFVALGELVGKLSSAFREANSQIEWKKIYAFRNVIAHDYFGVLPEEVWEIVVAYLPLLSSQLRRILSTEH